MQNIELLEQQFGIRISSFYPSNALPNKMVNDAPVKQQLRIVYVSRQYHTKVIRNVFLVLF